MRKVIYLLTLVITLFNYAKIFGQLDEDRFEEDFVIVVKTDNPGATADNAINIPLNPSYNYDFTVDWGDGSEPIVFLFGPRSIVGHTYPEPGEYTIRFRPNQVSAFNERIVFPTIEMGATILNSGLTDAEKLTEVKQWGDTDWFDFSNAFQGCKNLEITAQDSPNMSNVSDMSLMFWSCQSLGDKVRMSDWNTSNVTNMNGVFLGATNFNSNIDNWNVEMVTVMSNMFRDASSFNQSIAEWNTSNVVNMINMFSNASSFNQSIADWDTSSVIDMFGMFSGATNFNSEIRNWNVSKVKDMRRMFANASLFNKPLSWEVGSVNLMSSMFDDAISFDQPLDSWNVENVMHMEDMFKSAISFNQDLNSWNTSNVQNMSGMFREAISFNGLIQDWNTSKVEKMGSMFQDASSFNQPLVNWNVSAVTNMFFMFNGASSFNQDLNSWDISSISNGVNFFSSLRGMFIGSNLSTDNYDATLTGWASLDTGETQIPQNVIFGGGGSRYNTAANARQTLIDDFGWTITDGGIADSEETTVTLSNGKLLIIDANGGNSDDEFILSINGDNLHIQNIGNSISISGDSTQQIDANTVEVPLANITNGIVLEGGAGNNKLDIATSVSLLGTGNDLTVRNTDVRVFNTGSDNLRLNGLNVYGSDYDTNNLTTTVTTTANFFNDSGLVGIGTIAGTVNMNAFSTIAPGTSPGILTTGDLMLTADAAFSIEINGPTPGTEHDQIKVMGTVDLGGALLDINREIGSEYSGNPGDELLIIDNDGNDPVTGTFADLAEGTAINEDFIGTITYTGGDGNDVALIGPIEEISDLIITEIMYNPANSDNAWEYIEIYNTTENPLNISGYVIDDDSGPVYTEPSIPEEGPDTPPTILESHESAILFNGTVRTIEDFQNGWGDVNAIPLPHWSGLRNSGDSIGIWEDLASYQADKENETNANAIELVTYGNGGVWPNDNGFASIYLRDLEADRNDGNNWLLSTVGTETPVFEGYTFTPFGNSQGFDVGSPGIPNEIVDTEEPILVSINPVDNAVDIPVNEVLKATFNEPVQWRTDGGNIFINNGTTGNTHITYPSGSPLVTFEDNSIILDPENDFVPGNVYMVQVSPNALEDVDGNAVPAILSANWSFTVEIEEDVFPPMVECPTEIVVFNDPGACGAIVDFPDILFSDEHSDVTLDLSIESGSLFEVGNIEVTATATDAAGNEASCSFNVVVEDNEEPMVLCKDAILQLDETGNVIVSLGDIDDGISDNCAIQSVDISPTSFTTENLGENTVVVTVTDETGNNATCNSTVTVLPFENNAFMVTSFTLIDAVENMPIDIEFTDGMQIDINTLPTRHLDIRANTTEDVESVRISLAGALTTARTESLMPFALYRDLPIGDYIGEDFIVGQYSVSATPYSLDGLGGEMGAPLTINFELVDGDPACADLMADVEVVNPTICNGDSRVTIIPSGGTPPYEVAWQSFSSEDETIEGLTAGTYSANVTDDNGCTIGVVAEIVNPESPEVTLDPFVDVFNTAGPFALTGGMPEGGTYSGEGVADGMFDPSIGVGSYEITYVYEDPISLCENSAIQILEVVPESGLVVTGFTLIDADENIPIDIEFTEGVQIDINRLPTRHLDIRVNTTDEVESVRISLDGALTTARTESLMPFALYRDLPIGDYIGEDFIVGQYSVTATPYSLDRLGGEMGTPLTLNFELVDGDPACESLTADVEVVNPMTCGGGGEITITPSGGTPPYEVAWTSVSFVGETITGLSAGTYSAKVYDANGCNISVDAEIKDPELLEVTLAPFADVFVSDLPLVLSGGMPEGGEFSGEGVSAGIFEPSTPGTYEITYTYEDPVTECVDSAIQEIVVKPVTSNEVIKYWLVNADNEMDLFKITDGLQIDIAELYQITNNLDIRAETGSDTESVGFELSGTQSITRGESVPPYVLFQDLPIGDFIGHEFDLGEYTLSGTPYTQNGLQGDAGETLTIDFEFVDSTPTLAVTSFTLIDAESDLPIDAPLVEGAQFTLEQIGTLFLDIRANTTDDVESVRLELTGQQKSGRTESLVPYALFRDFPIDDYIGNNFEFGTYTVTATPYSGNNLSGEMGTPLSITFEIVVDLEVNSLTISPNQATTLAKASFDQPTEIKQILIFDMSGRMIESYNPQFIKSGDDYILDVNFYQQGTYIVKMLDYRGVPYQKQMVVKR